MKSPLKFLSLLVALSLLSTASCGSMRYGGMDGMSSMNAMKANSARGDYDMSGSEDDDPVGTWVFVTLVVAAGVASAVLVPLYLTDKL